MPTIAYYPLELSPLDEEEAQVYYPSWSFISGCCQATLYWSKRDKRLGCCDCGSVRLAKPLEWFPQLVEIECGVFAPPYYKRPAQYGESEFPYSYLASGQH